MHKMKKEALENAMSVLSDKIDIPGQPTDWFEMTQDRVNNFC